MDKSFLHNTAYTWEGKPVGYCGGCECFCIQCPVCENVSCNGAGCRECCGDTPETDFSLRWSRDYDEITKNWSVSDDMHVDKEGSYLDSLFGTLIIEERRE